MRSLLWASIDNDDSRDLDQLSVAEALPNGETRVFVAIADVDALVKKGTPLDERAAQNTTSVYTAGGVFPMLPEKLSTDLTSLNPDEDRLAVVIEFVVDGGGAPHGTDVYRALVHNKAKLAYDARGRVARRAAARCRRRWRRSPESTRRSASRKTAAQKLRAPPVRGGRARPRDDRGPGRLRRRDDHGPQGGPAERAAPAHRGLHDRGERRDGALPRSRRASRRSAASCARPSAGCGSSRSRPSTGSRCPPEPDSKALETFLRERRKADPLRFPDLSLVIVKLMGAGEYVLEVPGQTPVGHFGLAVRDYTHSTAPNRRYPDVITQRLLKAALARRTGPLRERRAREPRAALHGPGGRGEQGRAPRAQVGGGAPPPDAASASASTAS